MNEASSSHKLSPVLLISLVLVVLGAGVAYALTVGKKENKEESLVSASPTPSPSASAAAKVAATWPVGTDISWGATQQGSWMTFPYDSVPPECPSPLELKLPTNDISKATSILYPGQSRQGVYKGLGGTYKAHGGIRFDGSANEDISVEMPFNGSVFRGARTLINGEIQYGFDIVNQCGIMIRFGHLLTLTPAFQAIADSFPIGTIANSQTSVVKPIVAFKQGDPIASAVGFKNDKNVGFDYGVYDLRKDNEASKDPAYKALRAETAELSFHGLCWIENLPSGEKEIVEALPGGDSVAGKKSDYCK